MRGLRIDFGFARGGGASVDPIDALFADGTNGFDYDFSRTDTLYIAGGRGEAQVTTAGNNIGFVFDRHGWEGRTLVEQLATESELITNGDFSSATGWTQGSGSFSAPIAGGVATVQRGVGAGTASSVRQAFTTETGAWYFSRWDNPTLTGTGNVVFNFGDTEFGNQLAAPLVQEELTIFDAVDTTSFLWVNPNSDNMLAVVDNISVRKVIGNHSQQTNNSLRPTWQTIGAADFNLATAVLPTFKAPGAGANTLIVQAAIPASISALQVIAGTKGATDGRFALGVNTSGQAVGLVGTQTETTIVGTTDLRGTTATLQLVADGSTVTLYVNGISEYTAAQSGAPTTSVTMMLGALNNNGTAASHFAGSILRASLLEKAVTA